MLVRLALLCAVTLTGASGSSAYAEGVPMVFFDSNSAQIGPEQASFLDHVVSKVASLGPDVRLSIVGGTDRTGSDQYNLVLGLQRARAVRDYLVAKGVPIALMRVESAGERKPLNETPDEVADRQNRYVIIAIGPGD